MAGYVTTMDPGDVVDARPHFTGAWREFRRERLDPGGVRSFRAERAELALIVIAGSGTTELDGDRHPLDAGASLVLGDGAALEVRAGAAGLDLFLTVLDLAQGERP